ncbi:hypothetical protein H0E87_022235 [Populus deltoides]|uniref:GDSL esterase/lipase n=1 Tax=Populus deltoides TaxID=3696 RepID=A0A8T2XLH7_POPDE|nr:hypothetical protein H0E87_022235 [Populus deltoides]
MIWFNKFLESQGCKGAVSSRHECKAVRDDALIWVGEIGVNDYAYIVGSSVSSDTIRKLAINHLHHRIPTGLPPTGCLPLAMALAPVDDRDDLGGVKTLNNQSYTHTVVYQKTVQDLRKWFPDAVITYLDYWNAYSMVMKNPKKYGFKEPFMACCVSGGPPYNFEVFSTCGSSDASAYPNPSQYINWEGVHLTEAMYKVLSRMFLSGTQSSSICFLEGQETARVNGS